MRIVNRLCRQFDLPPVLFVNPPQHEATDLEHGTAAFAII